MKKIIWILLVGVLLTVLCCYNMFTFPKEKTEEIKLKEMVENIMAELSLEEKIAQMIIISNRTSVMNEELKNELEIYQPGGFIFFKENFSDYDNSQILIEEVKSTSHIPMFLSIDQEGGRVQRLTSETDPLITDIPSALEVGKTNDEELAYKLGTLLAEELQVFQINMDFAPVLDIFSNPQNTIISNRSFGNNADIVSKMGLALSKGLSEKGVIPVYKHFPGHGDTEIDSHIDLPILTKTKEELKQLELIPFQKAIEQNAAVIMVGHLAVPSLTNSNVPASLSKEIITGLLKEEMGFQGIVITDALNMKALTNNYTESEIYELAINAGVDILLMPNSIESAITSIKQSLSENKIDIEQINTSVRKILTLKYSKLSNTVLDKSFLGNAEHQQIIKEIQGSR